MNTHVQTVYPPVVTTAPRNMLRRSAAQLTFDDRILVELAQELRDPVLVMKEYGYEGRNAFNLVASPIFQSELKRQIDEAHQALDFRQRARLMANDVLEVAYEIATDTEASDANRLDAGKWIAKMGDLEPDDKKQGPNQAFQLILNMA